MTTAGRTGWFVMIVALVVLAALGLTGVVRIPYLTPASSGKPVADRPDELEGADALPGRELAASGANAKKTPAVGATETPAEPVLPSEAKGTAIAKAGGSIRGRVVEGEAKHPVQGATVELLMPEALFHYLKASSVGRFDRLTVQTDAEGKFALTDVLAYGGYALRARKDKGPFATMRDLWLASWETIDVGDIVIGPSGGVSGHVLGADGKGIADAKVSVTWEIANDFDAVMADPDTLPWVEADVKTDAEGGYKLEGLEPGKKTVVVKAPSGAADVKTPVVVTAANVTSGVDVTLGGSLPIAGRVEWADGKPIEGARVFAKTMKNAACYTGESAVDGSFRMTGVAEGMYFVGAFIPGMSAQLVPGKKAGDENVKIVVPLAGALSGSVVSKSTGLPIRQYKLTPVFTDQQGWMQKMVGEKIDRVLGGAGFQSPEGTFHFDRLKPGHYTLHVEAEGYPPTDSPPVEVIAGAEAKATAVELPDGNRVSGVVRDATGAPIADARVVIGTMDNTAHMGDDATDEDIAQQYEYFSNETSEETPTDAQGRFVTDPLTPRVYRLGASAKGYVPRVLGALDASSKSIAGLEFRLDRAGVLVLHAKNARGTPVAGAELLFCRSDGFLSFARSDEQGRVEKDAVKPGRWAAAEFRREISMDYGAKRSDTAHWNGPAYFDQFCAMPNSVEYDVIVGGRVEPTVTVRSRVRVEGKARLGSYRAAEVYILLRREDDFAPEDWISVEEDGSFAEDSVASGKYRVLRWLRSIEGGRGTSTPVGTLEVIETDMKGVEIDLSK